jgi:hypothetical protein
MFISFDQLPYPSSFTVQGPANPIRRPASPRSYLRPITDFSAPLCAADDWISLLSTLASASSPNLSISRVASPEITASTSISLSSASGNLLPQTIGHPTMESQEQANVLVDPERYIVAQTSQSSPSPVSLFTNVTLCSVSSIPLQRIPIQTGEPDEKGSVCHSPGFETKLEKLNMLRALRLARRGAHAVARNESTKNHSPTTEDKALRDTNDDKLKLMRSPSIEASARREGSLLGLVDDWEVNDSLVTLLHNPPPSPRRRANMSSSRRSSLQVRTSVDPTTIGGKTAVASLELLESEDPFQPKISSPAEVSSHTGSSPPMIIQTLHKTEEFASPHTASTIPQSSQCLRRGSGKSKIIQRESLIEIDLVEALRCLQVRPNFQEIVSTTNGWGQTLAHLSIFYGYPSLLSSLVDWRINLTIADGNGFTALHYAYMKGDLDSVRILRRGGASEIVMDKLGRTPLDLQPEGFSASIDIDAKVAVESDSIIPSSRRQE